MLTLRELIRQVRQCKSASAERSVISKELADIRTAIKDKTKLEFRHRNVAKLMYVDMLGYPTHFGQMEVLKLLASKSFVEKRLGYLALMQLLDENTEVLMLATQSLKRDMTHENPFIVGLALCAFGNISSTDIARDLSTELANILKHNNPYIRKKAMCCAIRVVTRLPNLCEDYFKIAIHTLEDSSMNHGPLIATVQLLIRICITSRKLCRKMRKHSHHIINRLQSLLRSTFDADHDIGGVTDPFLQVQLLHLLRIISIGDKKLSDEVDNTLAQIATNTESNKNPGNSILYECVRTIMCFEKQSSLHVLAINILGRFLVNRDNNVRYVALNALCNAVKTNTDAIQRHRNTIVDCLKDSDLTIRTRALHLIYALTNEGNVHNLCKDLIGFLALTSKNEPEFRNELASKICLVVERYAPSRKWHIDTIVEVMSIIEGFIREQEIAQHLYILIANSTAIQPYIAHKLCDCHQRGYESDTLRQLMCWCIGEYGHTLVDASLCAKAQEMSVSELDTYPSITVSSAMRLVTKKMNKKQKLKEKHRKQSKSDRHSRNGKHSSRSHRSSGRDRDRDRHGGSHRSKSHHSSENINDSHNNNNESKNNSDDEEEDGDNDSDEEENEENEVVHEIPFVAKTESEIVQLLAHILENSKASAQTKAIALTALLKSEHRFPSQQNEIHEILVQYSDAREIEVQQRSVEFLSLYDNTDDTKRNKILKPMPVPAISRLYDIFAKNEQQMSASRNFDLNNGNGNNNNSVEAKEDTDESSSEHSGNDSGDEDNSDSDSEEDSSSEENRDDEYHSSKARKKRKELRERKRKYDQKHPKSTSKTPPKNAKAESKRSSKSRKSKVPAVPTILGPESDGAQQQQHKHNDNSTQQQPTKTQNGKNISHNKPPDLMQGLFGDDSMMNTNNSGSNPGAQTSQGTVPTSIMNEFDPLGLGLFDNNNTNGSASLPALASPMEVFNKNGISAVFQFVRSSNDNSGGNNGVCNVIAHFKNTESYTADNFSFMVAVPRYIKLKIKAADGTKLLGMNHNRIEQKFQLTNSQHGVKPFVIRMQFHFTVNGIKNTEQAQASLPANCC